MHIEIGEVTSSVQAVDDSALLSPHVLQRIVEIVLQAVEHKQRHHERVESERRITGGVDAEQENEA